jgi:chondroitin synthase
MIVSAQALSLPKMLGAGNDYSFLEESLGSMGLGNSLETFVPSNSLSVVIPVLDRPELLRLGLESFRRQKNQRCDLEIIVVDDGSGPEVKRVCDESGLPALKYIRRDPDPRFTECAARNEGIRAARNEIILQLDPEIIFPSEYAVNWIMRWFEPGVNVVVTVPRLYIKSAGVTVDDVKSGKVIVRETGESDLREPLFEDSSLLKHRYLPFLEVLGFCMAYRREMAIAVGGWAEEWTEYGGADQEFAYRIYQRGAFCIYERNAIALHLEHPVSERTGRNRAFLADRSPPYRAHRFVGKPLAIRASVPRVSIFIPAYNVAEYIDDALISARNQSYKDLEICVCDDGSDDGTGDIVERHAREDDRVKWIRTNHQGCAAASNSAVGLARGEFLLQLDGDDVLASRAAEIMVRELDRRPWVGLVFANLLRTDEKLRPLGLGHVFRNFRRFQMLMCMPVTAPRMWRYRLHSLVGGWSTALNSAVDYDLFLRMAERSHFYHIDELLYFYRQRQGSLSKERDEQFSNARQALQGSIDRMGLSKRFRIVSSESNHAKWYEFEELQT